MSNCLTEDLKKDGHQPCKYIDHIQGTNQNEWKCPLCKEIYVSVDPAYCEDCLESIIFIKERIETYKKKKDSIRIND